MPRMSRAVIPAVPHYLAQRGNRREAVFFADPDDPQTLATPRLNTGTGRPAGDKTFVAKLEAMVGRTLWPKAVGRPRKYKDGHEQ